MTQPRYQTNQMHLSILNRIWRGQYASWARMMCQRSESRDFHRTSIVLRGHWLTADDRMHRYACFESNATREYPR
jgi:hypothetical protein